MVPVTRRKKTFTMKWQIRFITMIFFTAVLFILKIVIGQLSNSVALIADSFHILTDFVALVIGFIALKTANRHRRSEQEEDTVFTFGWIRAEVLGGLVNTVLLMALSFSLLVNSLKRFIVPEGITEPKPVLMVGCASVAINLVGILLFCSSRKIFFRTCCLKNQVKETTKNIQKTNKHSEQGGNARSSRPQRFCKIGVLKNFAKLTGKHISRILFKIKSQAGEIKGTPTQVLPCEFCEVFKNVSFYRTPLVIASVMYSLSLTPKLLQLSIYCFFTNQLNCWA